MFPYSVNAIKNISRNSFCYWACQSTMKKKIEIEPIVRGHWTKLLNSKFDFFSVFQQKKNKKPLFLKLNQPKYQNLKANGHIRRITNSRPLSLGWLIKLRFVQKKNVAVEFFIWSTFSIEHRDFFRNLRICYRNRPYHDEKASSNWS